MEHCAAVRTDFAGRKGPPPCLQSKSEAKAKDAETELEAVTADPGHGEILAAAHMGVQALTCIPPRWAFGLAQSRWGYKTEEDVREVARQYKEHDLPLDMICMDIDYMQDYADFTVNKERFPDLAKLSADLKAQGIRLVPIIDAGVRIDPNDPTCTEGVEKGYFCKKADGTPFVAAVWPGKAYFADFLRPEVREWFGHKYKALTDCGIEGFWNDMNEPSLFYSPERLRAFLNDMAALRVNKRIPASS